MIDAKILPEIELKFRPIAELRVLINLFNPILDLALNGEYLMNRLPLDSQYDAASIITINQGSCSKSVPFKNS